MTPETMELETRDAGKDTKISRFMLDTEAEQLSSIAAYWGAQLADAKKSRDYLATELKCLRGEKYAYYKGAASPLGAKPTGDQVAATIDCDSQIVAKSNELSDAEYLVSMLYSTVDAIDKKKGMIDTLTKLYLANYYTKDYANQEPSTPDRNNLAYKQTRD